MSERIWRLAGVLAWGPMNAAQRCPRRWQRLVGIPLGMAAFFLTLPLQIPLMCAATLCEMWESTRMRGQ